MQYVITPKSNNVEPFCWWDDAFTKQELDYIQQQTINNTQRAQVGATQINTDELLKVRRSHISWINYNSETEWIFKKLSMVVSTLNSQFYRFDLTGFGEPLQLTNYHHIEEGMYRWHQDYGGEGISRKLSLVLQLSDPSEYEGGNLQLFTKPNIENIPKKRGLIVLFPSYQLHQVTPVTQGSRQSLVSWISGPPFK